MNTIQKFAKVFLTVIILANPFIANACTIFMANDGRNIWVGNNEDESSSTKYRMWYYPAKKENYGYMIWTELSLDKILYGLMYKNPQGGLNEYGLFMDYTAIDEVPVTIDPKKINRKKELVHEILNSCKTVSEAIEYISKFNLVR